MRDSKLAPSAFVVVFGGAVAVSSAMAGEHWKFNIVNRSNLAAVEFRTLEDGKWSPNWIKDRIEPGDKFVMDFGREQGDCTVRTEIRLMGGAYFDADVDYCKVSTLYIYDDKLTWD